MPIPLNKKLYNKVKSEAIHKFKVWPSAYASGWLVKEYKRRGGKYMKEKEIIEGVKRWFLEEWIDVCKLPKKVKCGRPKNTSNYKKKYPYCRPNKRVNSKTPKTVKEIGLKELKRRCNKKRKSPFTKVK